MTENEALKSALKKIIAQEKSNWGYIENFDVDENWAVRTAIEHVEQYRKIGTVEELAKIKEKDIARPVITNKNGVFCPMCCYWINHRQYIINAGEDHPNRCEWCGQKLNWEKENED